MTEKHKHYENKGLKAYITSSAVFNQIRTRSYINIGSRSVFTTRLSFAIGLEALGIIMNIIIITLLLTWKTFMETRWRHTVLQENYWTGLQLITLYWSNLWLFVQIILKMCLCLLSEEWLVEKRVIKTTKQPGQSGCWNMSRQGEPAISLH